MYIIREHQEENPSRICHVYAGQNVDVADAHDDALIGIDEEFLAWLYVAPGYEDSARSCQLLDLARQLLGSHAWVILVTAQLSAGQDEDALEALGLEVMESYLDTAPTEAGVNVHLTRTV